MVFLADANNGYLEGNGYIVSWCVGHLVELAQPEAYDERYGKWTYGDLPILPDDWKYEVSAGTRKQFGILKKLMARDDVVSLVCATDAGREGELIFRLVYHQCHCKKPFERLWISSMEDSAIMEGFENLKPGTEYDALYEAALCRERADWIVGINATRLFSTLCGQTLNVGRVMTPTLAMAVMREAAIAAFKPEPFYTVQIDLGGFTAVSERFKKKSDAEAVSRDCSAAVVTKAERKEKSEKPPALYDLTSLQRDANRVLGYTAQQTLDYTQNLYEKKLVTYPRTDSRYLTDDMAHNLPDLVNLAFHTFPVDGVDNVPVYAEQVVNNKKVTDHHAIIPTRELQKCNLNELPKGELAILQLISTRLFVAVGDLHRYIHGFEADIKTVEVHPQISEGFCGMEIMGKHYAEKADAGEIILAACKETKSADPVPLGSYRGFQMELSYDSFRSEYDIVLKGAMSHRVALGTDARGNITRLDNALSGIPERLERANEQLTNLYNQQEAAKAELGKPFPQEAELAAKSQRLAELDAALNMEDTVESRAEKSEAERPSVLADLKSKSEHIPPAKRSEGYEEVL